MFVAVEGCSHGELDAIYQELHFMQEQRKVKVDLLICCGDFQAVRSYTDLECMAVPQKYRRMQDFYKYYTGEKVAPVLTIFIGGNHEASNHLQELHYGGWAAPNIYYLGAAGCVIVNGKLRIAGLSGIFKQYHYLNGHFEMPPYDNNTCRSVYHYRNLEVFRLRLLSGYVDVMLSHDWPAGIYEYGNPDYLLRKKPFFRADMERGELGGWPAMKLLRTMQPGYWFSAHLHVSFRAQVIHEPKPSECLPAAPSTITQAEQASETPAGNLNRPVTARTTKFQALDKCLPRRHYLEILEINPVAKRAEDHAEENASTMPNEISRIEYDPEWLAVLKATNHLLSVKQSNAYMPATTETIDKVTPSPQVLEEVRLAFKNDFSIKPEWFYRSVAAHPGDGNKRPPFIEEVTAVVNEQTTRLCKLLNITDPMQALKEPQQLTAHSSSAGPNPAEISFFDDDDDDDLACLAAATSSLAPEKSCCAAESVANGSESIVSLVSNATVKNGAANDVENVKVNMDKQSETSEHKDAKHRPALVLPPPVNVKVDNIEFSESIPH